MREQPNRPPFKDMERMTLIVRLWNLGFSESEIAEHVHVKRGTVSWYKRRARKFGIELESRDRLTGLREVSRQPSFREKRSEIAKRVWQQADDEARAKRMSGFMSASDRKRGTRKPQRYYRIIQKLQQCTDMPLERRRAIAEEMLGQ